MTDQQLLWWWGGEQGGSFSHSFDLHLQFQDFLQLFLIGIKVISFFMQVSLTKFLYLQKLFHSIAMSSFFFFMISLYSTAAPMGMPKFNRVVSPRCRVPAVSSF